MHILIVKTSSLGDIIHTLPAITDLIKNKPNVSIDWVVEAAFTEIPAWHFAVNEVIPIHLRKLRRYFIQTIRNRHIQDFYKNIRKKSYDVILDAQGLLKSALVARFAKGKHYGLDYKSAKEPLASMFYDEKFFIAKNQHAILKLRQLFAHTFDYPEPTNSLDYGLNYHEFSLPIQLPATKNYLVFLHGTTWPSKNWPENYWKILAEKAVEAGFTIFLPWGNDQEYKNAHKICNNLNNIHILPHLSLTELASVLAHATGIVSVDTGLGHLACAFNVPIIGLYGPTDYHLTGMMGQFTKILCPAVIEKSPILSCVPCLQEHCTYNQPSLISPACFTTLTPELVFNDLKKLINKKLGICNEV